MVYALLPYHVQVVSSDVGVGYWTWLHIAEEANAYAIPALRIDIDIVRFSLYCPQIILLKKLLI